MAETLPGKLDVVLNHAKSRKIGDRRHRVDPGSGIHAKDEDAEDLEGHVPVPGGRDMRAAHKGRAEDAARSAIAFLAIDGTNGCLLISAVVRNVTFNLFLRLANQGIADFDILSSDRRLVLCLVWKPKQQREQYKARRDAHSWLHSNGIFALMNILIDP